MTQFNIYFDEGTLVFVAPLYINMKQ